MSFKASELEDPTVPTSSSELPDSTNVPTTTTTTTKKRLNYGANRSATISSAMNHCTGVDKMFSTVNEDSNEDSNLSQDRLFFSDASRIPTSICVKHVVPDYRRLALESHSQPNRGLNATPIHVSQSTNDLLAHPAVPEGFSSDHEDELVAECYICYHPFDESNMRKVPRNLECGHAYCTGILIKSA